MRNSLSSVYKVAHEINCLGGTSILKSNASNWSIVTLSPDIGPMYFNLKSTRAFVEFIANKKGLDFFSYQKGLFNLYV